MKPIRAQIENIKKLRMDQILKIAQASIQDVVNDMQTPKAKGGNMPVDTGYLRNSLVSGIHGGLSMGPTSPNVGGGSSSAGAILAISNMSLGDNLQFAYTANYAVHQELGARGMPGNYFVATAAKRFPEYVNKYAAMFK